MVDSTELHCHEYCHANRSDKERNHVYLSMPGHERLKVGALASVLRKHPRP